MIELLLEDYQYFGTAKIKSFPGHSAFLGQVLQASSLTFDENFPSGHLKHSVLDFLISPLEHLFVLT